MSSNIGNILKVSIFGESHAKAIGMTIDGLPAGIKIDNKYIKEELAKRKPRGDISTSRVEDDEVIFLSGVFNGFTTGSPLAFIIENKDVNSSDYIEGQIRPSHADLTNYLKYSGYNDYRGGGFTSGRITASIVVLGAICKSILKDHDIKIGTHISNIHGINDKGFDMGNLENDIDLLNSKYFAVLDEQSEMEMLEEISNTGDNGDSVGGELESVILGVPIGLGEPYFDSLESTISHLLFSIGGVKGVLFGDGYDFVNKFGSEVKDELEYVDNKIVYLANHNGGINGGISNGEPIIIKTIVKPTPSIALNQSSINVEAKENINLELSGRFDPCIVHRVRAVVDSLLAFSIVDMLMLKESKNI